MTTPLIESRDARKKRERKDQVRQFRGNFATSLRRALRGAVEAAMGTSIDDDRLQMKNQLKGLMLDPYGYGRTMRLLGRVIKHKLDHAPRKVRGGFTRYPDGYKPKPGEVIIESAPTKSK